MGVVSCVILLHLLTSKIYLRMKLLGIVLISTCGFKNDLNIFTAKNRFLKGFESTDKFL